MVKPLRILIADDEPEARKLVIHYLGQQPHETDIAEAGDGRTTLQLLKDFNPHILFLDIRMPELTGIQVMEQRGEKEIPAVIFITAFEQYALPAFDFEATDYLLKPFDQERFNKAFERAIKYLALLQTIAPRSYPDRLSFKIGTKTHLVPVDEIEYFQSEGAYVNAIALSRSWVLNLPLYEIESMLDPARFVRVHKSAIVNIQSIRQIVSLLNGDCMIRLQSGKEIRGSRTYREGIRRVTE